MKRVVSAVVLSGVILAGCASGEADVLGQSNKASIAQIDSLFTNAGEAEDEYFATQGSYTSDVGALQSNGLNVPAGISLSVASADSGGFCLQASGGVTKESTWHYSSQSQTPLPGKCA